MGVRLALMHLAKQIGARQRYLGIDGVMGTLRGHPILFLSREKIRKNKIFKNNKLKTGPLFRKTSPSESVHGFLFDFDESLAHDEL